MTHAELVVKMQAEVATASLTGGLSDETIGSLQTLTLQVINMAEKDRQSCLAQVDDLRSKILALEGQAAAHSRVMSSTYLVFHTMLERVQRGIEEQKAREAERAAKAAEQALEAQATNPVPSASLPRRRGRPPKVG